LGARAFTSAGVVYLPDDIGALDSVEGRAVLAHEMTHVAQQRVFGTALPGESTPAGQELEAQAVAAERVARGGFEPTSSVGPVHPLPVAATGSPVDSVGSRAMVASWVAPGPVTDHGPAVQRLPVGVDAPPTELPQQPAPGPSMQEIRDELGRHPPRRWVNIDAAQELEELANLLYDRLHHRLRTDVLVQRERSGLLMDYR
jgi:hypothetical protein